MASRLAPLALGMRIVLSVTIATSAITKATSMPELFATLGRSGLMLPGWERPAAYALVAAEFLVAAMLVLPRLRFAGTMAMAGLSSLFFGYSIWRWWEDIKALCGCFGVLFQLTPLQSGALSLGMCFAAMACLRFNPLFMDVGSNDPERNLGEGISI